MGVLLFFFSPLVCPLVAFLVAVHIWTDVAHFLDRDRERKERERRERKEEGERVEEKGESLRVTRRLFFRLSRVHGVPGLCVD